MNILAIDTTSTSLSIALIKGDEVLSFTRELGKSGHSSALMPEIETLLREQRLDVSELDAVGVVVGPGSFTGIRIGVSAMTAIAFATGAKRIAVTSFELIAYNKESVLAAVDAGHGNLYVAECENGRDVSERFVEAADAKQIASSVELMPCEAADKVLAKVVMQKALNGEYVEVFEPYYMRKSQAEREKDEI